VFHAKSYANRTPRFDYGRGGPILLSAAGWRKIEHHRKWPSSIPHRLRSHIPPSPHRNHPQSHSNADETYSGISVIDLLARLGVPRGKNLHGKALSEYIVTTGSDGYKAVLALAEADPEFHRAKSLWPTPWTANLSTPKLAPSV